MVVFLSDVACHMSCKTRTCCRFVDLGAAATPRLVCADMFAWRLAVGWLQVVKKTVAQQRADKNYGQKVQAYYDKYKEKKRKKKPLKS